MRAGRVYDFTAQGDVCKGTGGKGAAEAPSRCHGLEHPRQRREYDKKTPRIGASEAE